MLAIYNPEIEAGTATFEMSPGRSKSSLTGSPSIRAPTRRSWP